MATKKRKFGDGGDVSDVSPEDVAERKRLAAAGRAYNREMPVADTTFGTLKREAKPSSGIPSLKPMIDRAKARAKVDEETAARASRTNPMGDTYKKGGSVGSASKRADGIAQRGKTRGTNVAMCGGGMAKRK